MRNPLLVFQHRDREREKNKRNVSCSNRFVLSRLITVNRGEQERESKTEKNRKYTRNFSRKFIFDSLISIGPSSSFGTYHRCRTVSCTPMSFTMGSPRAFTGKCLGNEETTVSGVLRCSTGWFLPENIHQHCRRNEWSAGFHRSSSRYLHPEVRREIETWSMQRETIDLPNDFQWTMKTRCRHRIECVFYVAFWSSTVVSAFLALKSNLCLSSSLRYCSIVLLACNKTRHIVSTFSFAPWNDRKRTFRCFCYRRL